MRCLHCGHTDADVAFPLGRPRKDGSRHPFRYCDRCLGELNEAHVDGLPYRLRHGGTEAQRRSGRESMRRRRAEAA